MPYKLQRTRDNLGGENKIKAFVAVIFGVGIIRDIKIVVDTSEPIYTTVPLQITTTKQ